MGFAIINPLKEQHVSQHENWKCSSKILLETESNIWCLANAHTSDIVSTQGLFYMMFVCSITLWNVVVFRCLAGFSGQFCEIEVNECNSSPCLHGSTCADHINGYTCKCQQGNCYMAEQS